MESLETAHMQFSSSQRESISLIALIAFLGDVGLLGDTAEIDAFSGLVLAWTHWDNTL